MNKSIGIRLGITLAVTLMSAIYVYPTLSGRDLTNSKFPYKQKVNLGLDLQGGLYIVMGADFNKVFREIVDRQAVALESRLKSSELSAAVKSVKAIRDGEPIDDPKVEILFEQEKRDPLHALLKNDAYVFRFVEDKGGRFLLGLTSQYRQEIREKTINQSIEVIRNRIDEFGVAEPSIVSQGSDRLVVELPGVKDVERAKALIGRTAKLEFRIVDDEGMDPSSLMKLVEDFEIEKKIKLGENGLAYSEYVRLMNEGLKAKLPKDRILAFERPKNEVGEASMNDRIPYLLSDRTEVTGQDLNDAFVSFNQQENRPEVAFRLNPRGATAFEKLTGDNIRKRLAIVLDGIVHSAPVINSQIGGSGVITLGRGQQDKIMKEAQDLSIVLRAGALPAQLDFLEQRVVGPSLGQDSIKKAAYACILGALVIFIFSLMYYRLSGLVAVVSLSLNVLFVLAFLVGIEATLTLPGIAGVGLTVGIAVDSNIVIFERIREELRAGKSILAAIEAGFDKAFRTILDANVTNAAAAVILLAYGSGPIKGFAVSMLVGIVTTLFSAVFVCRLLFDMLLKWKWNNSQSTEMSI